MTSRGEKGLKNNSVTGERSRASAMVSIYDTGYQLFPLRWEGNKWYEQSRYHAESARAVCAITVTCRPSAQGSLSGGCPSVNTMLRCAVSGTVLR